MRLNHAAAAFAEPAEPAEPADSEPALALAEPAEPALARRGSRTRRCAADPTPSGERSLSDIRVSSGRFWLILAG